MEKNGMGSLLSLIFLILGTSFLPEPIDAAPQDYRREERNASPEPRCPNCPKDCPENLSGGLPETELDAERYSPPETKPVYSPPYNSVQPAPPYAPPRPASYAHYQSSVGYPPSAYQHPAPPPPTSYGLPAPFYGAPPYPGSYAAPPPPPPVSYAAPPAQPAPYYGPAVPATPAPPANTPPPPVSYSSPNEPPPPATEKPVANLLDRASSPAPPAKLPPPPAIPNEPPLSEKPCFEQPPAPSAAEPEIYDSLPLPRYNHLSNPWTPLVPPARFRSSGYNPYAATPYRASYLNARPSYSCSCGDAFDLDDDDEVVFSKYNRRSSDNSDYRHSAHHQDHFVDPLNSPSSMYKNYRPYEREEGRGVFSEEFASEERSSGKERLYVVYRADAVKERSPSSSAPASSMTDREIDSMIRRAIEVSRQQRARQDNVLYSRADPRYRYQLVSQQPLQRLDEEQPEFRSLQYPLDYRQPGYQLSPVQIMDNEAQYVVREEADEANNPGWDQTKWTAVPATSADFDQPETVYAANIALGNGATATASEFSAVPAIEALEPEKRLEKKETGEPEPKEIKTEEVELIEDMELPRTVTEASSFDRTAETTTEDGPK